MGIWIANIWIANFYVFIIQMVPYSDARYNGTGHMNRRHVLKWWSKYWSVNQMVIWMSPVSPVFHTAVTVSINGSIVCSVTHLNVWGCNCAGVKRECSSHAVMNTIFVFSLFWRSPFGHFVQYFGVLVTALRLRPLCVTLKILFLFELQDAE